jgi:HEAT repeats
VQVPPSLPIALSLVLLTAQPAWGDDAGRLLRIVEKGDGNAKHRAFHRLGKLGARGAAAVPRLLGWLDREGRYVVRNVRSPRHHLGPNQRHLYSKTAGNALVGIGLPAVPVLLRELKSTRGKKKHRRAMVLLGILKRHRLPAGLRRQVRSALDAHVKEQGDALSVSTLRKIGGVEARGQLIRRLGSAKATERGFAAIALGKLRAQKAVPQLIEVLSKDPSTFPRQYAAKTLGAIKDPSAVPALSKAALSDSGANVREGAVEALACFPGEKLARQALRRAIADRHRSVRLRAAHAFWRIRDPAAVTLLLKQFPGEPWYLTRDYMIHALWKQRARQAIPALERYLKKASDPKQEHTARRALDVLRGKVKLGPEEFAR